MATAFPAHDHDHTLCVADALDVAATVCRQRGARLTELRKRVLSLVWESHAPIGAYELIDKLARARSGDDNGETVARVAPPTVYRALDFLMEQGLVHRIESLNAFVGCQNPDHPHRGYFLICEDCGCAHELKGSGLDADLRERAGALGFAVNHITIEVTGLCPDCDHHPSNAQKRNPETRTIAP